MQTARICNFMAKQKIKINLTDEDLSDLQNGGTFDWTFPDQNGKDIDVHLYFDDGSEPEDEDEEEDEDSCSKCGKSGSFPDGQCESCYQLRN